MIYTHNLSSILFTFGPISVRWYGLMYALGFLAGYFFLHHAVKKGRFPIRKDQIDQLLLWIFVGVIVGGRLGDFLLYRPQVFFTDPLEIFRVWHGGMSFHGGLIGVILALLFLARRWKISLLVLADTILVPVALALCFGRIGNFINGELWGRVTDGSWGVIFSRAGDALPRHPSQLYEAAYSLGIFSVLFWLWQKKMRAGTIGFIFLLLYGICRIIVEEFFREPLDGFIGPLTKGAAYSLPLVIIGVAGLIRLYRRHES